MKRTCSKGHKYNKSSLCPTCPVWERGRKISGDLPHLSAPTRRALENAGIKKLKNLSQWKREDLLKLHGVGPASFPIIKRAMATKGLKFK